mmetsp:Transcript_19955/g.43540  ORF Transcript_19955/g.43540 Transcript_19955/m.43540 type:complete len:621 (-) Transcript_19955:149-2011(-)
MAPAQHAESCVTLEDYITGIIVKELWASQLQRLEDSETFEPWPVEALVQRLAPSLASDVLSAATSLGLLPAHSEVDPTSLLPDLDHFPAIAQDADGLTLAQRKLLLEVLTVVLDVFSDSNVVQQAMDEDPMLQGLALPLLPGSGMPCVVAQIAAALEHLSILQPRDAQALLHTPDVDLATWNRIHSINDRPAGSKQELVEELQQCRQQIFNLEKELVRQARVADLLANRGKRESDKAVERLLSVNVALEEKLKQRVEEQKVSSQQLIDLQRRVDHERWLLGEKDAKIADLEDALEGHVRMQEDLLRREKEYGKRLLRVQLQEFEGVCRNNERMRRLQSLMVAEQGVEIEMARDPTQKDVMDLVQTVLQDLEHDLDVLFEERSLRLSAAIRRCDNMELRTREEKDEGPSRGGTRSSRNKPQVAHALVQTDPAPSPPDAASVPSPPSRPSSVRSPADPHRRRSASAADRGAGSGQRGVSAGRRRLLVASPVLQEAEEEVRDRPLKPHDRAAWYIRRSSVLNCPAALKDRRRASRQSLPSVLQASSVSEVASSGEQEELSRASTPEAQPPPTPPPAPMLVVLPAPAVRDANQTSASSLPALNSQEMSSRRQEMNVERRCSVPG